MSETKRLPRPIFRAINYCSRIHSITIRVARCYGRACSVYGECNKEIRKKNPGKIALYRDLAIKARKITMITFGIHLLSLCYCGAVLFMEPNKSSAISFYYASIVAYTAGATFINLHNLYAYNQCILNTNKALS